MKVTARWIVSPRYDLTFFVLSCLLTWAFLGLYHGLRHYGIGVGGESILITYFVFTAIFDHPHIFQTFSRTHLDGVELERHRRLHTWGLGGFIVAGVAIAAAGYLRQLIVFASIYGSWHIIRQHWGLLRAYKGRNGDTLKLDHLVDTALFYTGMIGFWLNDYSAQHGPTVVYGELDVQFPRVPPELSDAAWYVFLVVLSVFVLRQLQLVKQGRPINLPKLVFLTAAIGTHGLVFYATATPFLIAEALETAYHNVQYQGWVMHYQRRRFGGRRVVRRWLGMALVYGLVVGTIEVIGLHYSELGWLFIPFFMVVVWHYYVDGKIWRMGSDPDLRRTVLSG